MLSAGELGAAGGHTAAASAERSPTAPSPRSADREQGVPVPHPAGSCGRPEGPELGAMGLCWPGTRAGHRVSFLPEGNSLRVGEILLGRGQAGQIDRAQPAPSAPAGSSGVRWVRWELRGHGVLPGT